MKGWLESKIKTIDENGTQILQMPNSVNFVVVTKDKYVILGEQLRMGIVMKNCLGGYIEDGEDIDLALCREMEEETNITSKDILFVEYVYKNKYVSVGYTTERNSLAIVRTMRTLKELTGIMKCNDTKENITFSPIHFSKIDYLNTLGLKTEIALNFIKNMFTE
jgi:ADP-ribose pyrophosphatase YjhB (NUDIX family)